MKWTTEEEAVLRKCVSTNLSMNQVTSILKSRSRDSIWSKLKAMNLHLPVYYEPKIDYQALRDLTGEVVDG
jgi:hypothetical protein